MDELLTKHLKEKRDLSSRIAQKKKNATKKTRKGVTDECERLERLLAEQQAAEIAELKPQDPEQLDRAVEGLSIVDLAAQHQEARHSTPKDLAASAVDSPTPSEAGSDFHQRSKKPNRQKARLARRAAEQDAAVSAAEQEAKDQPDRREQEQSSMKKQMESLKLRETSIRPDGHCLFSACAHSMPSDTLPKSTRNKEPYQTVRTSAADFMSSHPDDFAPFLEEPLDTYITKIRDTAEWGGQLELQAIARSYNIDINVLQADGRIERIRSGASDNKNVIWLAYYRHSFGLGEHYNALTEVEQGRDVT
ncbi:uncharacterized protein A1O9_00091 [Exophiala aquamarina CBS 119918]|uniref:OTU domain-containing protein n=1 Tax=Exophiala aquamarina CBS 119918 TaxID=1182545 RepID=A0A072PPS7_9EURO|nr:uncharacterized protein A1O9_00091 [Exophiala aquamarina CBS 119918]KEF62119.1 hypothetical protein A1O9_00091 [Exophiala aquamarina CBS 119918]